MQGVAYSIMAVWLRPAYLFDVQSSSFDGISRREALRSALCARANDLNSCHFLSLCENYAMLCMLYMSGRKVDL